VGPHYGAADEFEFGGGTMENKMHVHDLHATILALMGFDHTKLTFTDYNGTRTPPHRQLRKRGGKDIIA